MRNYLTTLMGLVTLTITSFGEEQLPTAVQRIVDVRKAEVRKIDEAYVNALERLQETYTKRGDLETAVAIKALMDEVDPFEGLEEEEVDPIIGTWSFTYSGNTRKFTFQSDGTMEGEYAGGGDLAGTWKRSGNKILITVVEDTYTTFWATVYMTDEGTPRVLQTKHGTKLHSPKRRK